MGESSLPFFGSSQTGRTQSEINITSAPGEVLPFLGEIEAQADSERGALGFIPAVAYEDAARAGRIFVAFSRSGGRREYMGHLLAGLTFPHARVWQITVARRFRGNGVGRALLENLVRCAEALGFMRISARVAEDLDANGFWEGAGFPVVKKEPGGKSRRRTINYRARWLDTPSLFGWTGSSAEDNSRGQDSVPTFVLDSGLFSGTESIPRRAERVGEAVGAIVGTEVNVVAEESAIHAMQELRSLGFSGREGDLVGSFPTLTTPDKETVYPYVRCLRDIVVSVETAGTEICPRLEAALASLATAIHHSADGFITSEPLIIAASGRLGEHFGLRVVDAARISEALGGGCWSDKRVRGRLSGGALRVLRSVDGAGAVSLRGLAGKAGISEQLTPFAPGWGGSSGRARYIVVTSDEQPVAFACWDADRASGQVLDVGVVSDEDRAATDSAVEVLLWELAREASAHGPRLLRVMIPDACVSAQERAIRSGFRRVVSDRTECTDFEHIAFGVPITGANWRAARDAVRAVGGIILPEGIEELADVGGVRITEGAEETKVVAPGTLEKALDPTILVYAGRDGVIVPIRPVYEKELLATSPQMSLLPVSEPLLFRERTYFRTARNAFLFAPGSPLVFYESGGSGGRSAAVAVARVVEVTVHSKADISPELLRRGVLEEEEIADLSTAESIAAVRFESVMALERPLSIDWLRKRGIVDGTNMVTARRISAHSLAEIVENGFDGGKIRAN